MTLHRCSFDVVSTDGACLKCLVTCAHQKCLLGIFNLAIMRNNPRACFFTNFACGLFGFDIEWQDSNSSAQSTKGYRAVPANTKNPIRPDYTI